MLANLYPEWTSLKYKTAPLNPQVINGTHICPPPNFAIPKLTLRIANIFMMLVPCNPMSMRTEKMIRKGILWRVSRGRVGENLNAGTA